jgi:hypothetical protein
MDAKRFVENFRDNCTLLGVTVDPALDYGLCLLAESSYPSHGELVRSTSFATAALSSLV